MKYIGTGEIWSDERIQGFIDKNIALYKQYGFCLWRSIRVMEVEYDEELDNLLAASQGSVIAVGFKSSAISYLYLLQYNGICQSISLLQPSKYFVNRQSQGDT